MLFCFLSYSAKTYREGNNPPLSLLQCTIGQILQVVNVKTWPYIIFSLRYEKFELQRDALKKRYHNNFSLQVKR